MVLKKLSFIFPIDGDMLNEYDGEETNNFLCIPVKVYAPAGHRITIHGKVMQYKEDGVYETVIGLNGYFNRIEATDHTTNECETITVYWIKNAKKRYRIAVDDVIWALRDIYENQRTYQSIFDNPYLAIFKRLHQDFGTVTHLNLFYETDNFNLSMMPEKFKEEWEYCADWLTLSFHAKGEFPDNPYVNASYNQVYKECKQVEDEIIRFAGSKVLNETTCTHWGSPNLYGSRALRSRGLKIMVGYFYLEDGKPFVSHYLDVSQTLHLEKRDYWKDNKEDIIFVKDDLILNITKKEEIISKLEDLKKDMHRGGYIQLLNHEQYYYDFYKKYQPDYEEKMRVAAKWLQDNGYESTKIEDLLLK